MLEGGEANLLALKGPRVSAKRHGSAAYARRARPSAAGCSSTFERTASGWAAARAVQCARVWAAQHFPSCPLTQGGPEDVDGRHVLGTGR